MLKIFDFKDVPVRTLHGKAIVKNDVTDVLMEAADCADDMKKLVILYEDHAGKMGMIAMDGMTFSELNWHLDKAKKYVTS